MKKLIVIILAIALLTGCSKSVETGPGTNGGDKALEPFAIAMVTDNREISLKENLEGTFDKPFQINFWFNGKLNIEDKDLGKYLVIKPEVVKLQVSIIYQDGVDTTRIFAEFSETESLPDEIQITLKSGIIDDKGNKLKEDITLSLTRGKQVEAYIKLKSDATISSETGMNFNSYTLDDKEKYFEITFNCPMDRESVENAFVDGLQYVEEQNRAKVSIDWKDDSNLTLHFTDMSPGQSYPISFNGAKTVTGAIYDEYGMNKVFGFLVQQSQKLSKVDRKGSIVKNFTIQDEILELEDISPDGRYAFGYRVMDSGGDYYPVKPILLEFGDKGIKKHFLKDINYLQDNIFGTRWFPDCKSFLVYCSKKVWLYSLEGALQGQPGQVIFEYDYNKTDYIAGVEISPDGSKIAVFKSAYLNFDDKDSKLVDIYYIDSEGRLIEKMEDVFYHSSSDGFVIPLKYCWKDNDTIVSEGFSQKGDEVNVYSINLKENKVEIIAPNASNPSLCGDIMVVRKAEFDKDNGYMAYGDGNIINLNNNNIEDVIFGNLSYSVYSLGGSIIAYELYEDGFTTYIYDRAQQKVLKEYEGMLFGADKDYFYILR